MGVKVLSLFDGMACGMLAMLKAEIEVDEYIAYEIDSYAIQTSTHNFPVIKECGDVFNADFTQYQGVDYVIGGSPCTYWSIAQKNNRETEASGTGWELFKQYVRAVREAQPKYFVYENNKSMSNAIRESITNEFGFEPICINSALVSAQNRQRLYWVGKRNTDGTYSKVDVEQPEDRGIILKDILESGADLTSHDKGFTLTASYNGAVPWNTIERSQRNMVVEPVGVTPDGKSQTLKAQYQRNSVSNFCAYTSTYGASGVAEPVACRCRGRKDKNGNGYAKYECREDNKANTLDTNTTNGSLVAEPVCVQEQVFGRKAQADGTYDRRFEARTDGKSGTLTGTMRQNAVAIPVDKSVALSSCGGGAGGKTGLYAVPVEFNGDIPIKAQSLTDGKTYTVYEVKDGLISIKGKQYPIKLTDGYYIIRKLTVTECKRLQTVPKWYEFPVSNNQAYKMLGNGWTVDVIAHILNHTKR